MNSKLPNLIIAGVNKAGTSSLFTYLSQHPEICGSSKKETCYFLPLRYNEKIEPINKYKSFFKHCKNEKVILEATPGYFYGGKFLIHQIKNTIPNTKLIFIFRDPIDRCFSFYKHLKSLLLIPKKMDFEEYVSESIKRNKQMDKYGKEDYFVRGLREGLYIEFITDWFNIFKEENIKIVFFDNLKENPIQLLNELSNWLKIDSTFYNNFSFEIENKSINYKNRFVHSLAINIYKKFEKVFRKNLFIKNNLKKFYFLINASKQKDFITQNTYNLLNDFYYYPNGKFRIFLEQHSYYNLPKWLKRLN